MSTKLIQDKSIAALEYAVVIMDLSDFPWSDPVKSLGHAIVGSSVRTSCVLTIDYN